MTKRQASPNQADSQDNAGQTLRKQAEEIMRMKNPNHSESGLPEQAKTLLHELRIHQIELEMQNEELRRTQEKLEISRIKYFNFYNLAPVGYFTKNAQGLIVEVNLTACHYLGVTKDILLNQPFTKRIVPEDQDIYYMFRKQIVEDAKPSACELRIERHDGTQFWARLEATLLEDVESEELRYYVVMIDITEKKIEEEHLRQAIAEVRRLKDQLKDENFYLLEEINLIHSHKNIVGNSEAVYGVLRQVEQVAPTDSRVLIQGETGTGKELIAYAIHNLSPRSGRLMIKVNCAALPASLIESELFGREKGAFTGALSKQIGRFELAHGSTIFLDEIDAMPMELQAKLLRVLESGEFERLGSPHTVKVDVRIISATNRDLAVEVREGVFREDLYYRLNVFQIAVPPLRDRREDILPIVWSFVQEFNKRMGKRIESIPQKDVEALQAYSWPGNIRELRNVTERAMIITSGCVLHFDVPKIVQSNAGLPVTLEEMEKRHIIEALNAAGWRVSGNDGAAKVLGINPKTLGSRMQKLGIIRNKKNP